ncbi:MAG: hypothetical protein OEV40_28000, partial [Acidimicrobiia bacterium]|nr:hypothetical protein [Acidimicrobiia bacterium]
MDKARTGGQDPFEFARGPLDVVQRQQRRADDAAVVEAPTLRDPPVERGEVGAESLGVIGAQLVLDPHGKRREQISGFDTLLVHELEPAHSFLGPGHIGDRELLPAGEHVADPAAAVEVLEERSRLRD